MEGEQERWEVRHYHCSRRETDLALVTDRPGLHDSAKQEYEGSSDEEDEPAAAPAPVASKDKKRD